MRLVNARFTDEVHAFWDERAATIEEQTTMPIQNHVEMGYSGQGGDPDLSDLITKLNTIDYYTTLLEFVYGDNTITEERIQYSLAQFVRSIQSYDSKYNIGRAQVASNTANFPNFTGQFQTLGCNDFLIRCYSNKFLSFWITLFKYIDECTIINSLDLVVDFKSSLSMEELNGVLEEFSFITSVTFFNSEFKKSLKVENCVINFVEKDITINSYGLIDYNSFIVDSDFFLETLNYNNCLNKKMSIDASGEIKNCPSMKKKFGNIKDVKLSDIMKNDTFKEKCNVRKDQIEVCKNCEFRYICMDCRAYVVDDNNIFSKPKKCKYDPYVGKWNKTLFDTNNVV